MHIKTCQGGVWWWVGGTEHTREPWQYLQQQGSWWWCGKWCTKTFHFVPGHPDHIAFLVQISLFFYLKELEKNNEKWLQQPELWQIAIANTKTVVFIVFLVPSVGRPGQARLGLTQLCRNGLDLVVCIPLVEAVHLTSQRNRAGPCQLENNLGLYWPSSGKDSKGKGRWIKDS